MRDQDLFAPAGPTRNSPSVIYRMLTSTVNAALRRAGIETVHTHTVVRRALNCNSVVVDLGANVGGFSADMDCECYALEPVTSLFDAIPSRPGLQKFNYAISSQNAPITLHLSSNPEANSIDQNVAADSGLAGSVTCKGITLEGFLREQGLENHVSLLKVDIEGAEKLMFAATSDSTLRSIPQISIEFHDFVPGSKDGPFVLATIKRLRDLGFMFVPHSYLIPTAEHGDVLFLQPAKCGLGTIDRLNLGLAIMLLRLQRLKVHLKGRWSRLRVASSGP